MKTLREYIKTHPIIYISRDIERSFGLRLGTSGYYSISNNSVLAKSSELAGPNVFLFEGGQRLSTRELLLEKPVVSYIKSIKDPKLVVFKNSRQIERICQQHGWTLINPAADISNTAEEKVTQVKWLGSLSHYLPTHTITITKEIQWQGKPFILQFNHAHTGMGTALIESEKDLRDIQEVFPNRPARCSDYILGPVFTNNNVVTPDTTLVGNISYQITGLPPFTDNPFATIGNDWALPHKILTDEQQEAYHTMAQDIGDLFRSHGWKGLFGIDVALEEKTGKLYLLEINARQPASTAFESELQEHRRDAGMKGITTFEAHLAALLDLPLTGESLIPLETGAQIAQRVTRYIKKVDPALVAKAAHNNFNPLTIGHSKEGRALLLMQSKQGIMAAHNRLNELGNSLL